MTGDKSRKARKKASAGAKNRTLSLRLSRISPIRFRRLPSPRYAYVRMYEVQGLNRIDAYHCDDMRLGMQRVEEIISAALRAKSGRRGNANDIFGDIK